MKLESYKNLIAPDSQSGQTLIETIIAIFVLVTALTSSLGLAVYVFSSSSLSQNEIVASNLAREGVEVVRVMRDSNWLGGDATGGAWDLAACADIGNRLCYPAAYAGPTYSLGSGNFHVDFDSNTLAWSRSSSAAYFLYLQSNGTYTPAVNGSSIFARMINITYNFNAPYTGSDPELIVKSVVAWQGKNCTAFNSDQNLLTLTTPCKVVVEEHLTNWKDYK